MEVVGTSTAGFLGLAERGPVIGRPVLLTSFAEYQRRFGGYLSELEYGSCRFLPNAVEQFFTNGGSTCYVMRVAPEDAAIAQSAEGPVQVTARDPRRLGQHHASVADPLCAGPHTGAGRPG